MELGGEKSKLFQKRHFIINFMLAVLCYVLSFNAFVVIFMVVPSYFSVTPACIPRHPASLSSFLS